MGPIEPIKPIDIALMILIAGVQPRTVTVDPALKRCPACGLHQASLKRVDHYFSVFFIPLLRVKKGEEALVCDRCDRAVAPSSRSGVPPDICSQCGRALDESFKFCPHCGRKQ
ncbi:MAG: zinc ribbon domain-containing protein [Desulfobacterales bacterium]|nr:zinc ribbon domain-containing protein [Desulfobacterales bacterium]